MAGRPWPQVATNAVGMLGHATLGGKPSRSRTSASRAAERVSRSAVSEYVQRLRGHAADLGGESRSTSASTAAFAFDEGDLAGAAEAQTAARSRHTASRMIDLQGSAKPSRGAGRGQALWGWSRTESSAGGVLEASGCPRDMPRSWTKASETAYAAVSRTRR